MTSPTSDELIIQGQYALIEKASESESRLNRIVNSLSNVVFETDIEGNWSFLNPAWTELTGFDVSASIGTSFVDFVYPDDRQRNWNLFEPLINREKDSCRHQVRYCHATDNFVWVEVYAKLIFDTFGNVIGTAGTLTNVHEQKCLFNQLKRKENILEAAHVAGSLLVNEALSQKDENLVVQSFLVAANLKYAVMSDIERVGSSRTLINARAFHPNESSLSSITKLTHNQITAAYPAFKCITMGNDEPDNDSYSCWESIDEPETTYCLMLPIMRNNVLCKSLLLSGSEPWSQSDINALLLWSKQYSLTLDRLSALNLLSQSETRLSHALEGSNEGMWDWNIQSGECYFSDRWAEILGYKRSELLPDVSTWSDNIHPEDLNATMLALNNHLDGKTPRYESTLRIKHKNGEWIWIFDRGKIVEFDQHGAPLRASGMILDVTEKVMTEITLAARTAELADANRELDMVLMISPVGFMVFDSNKQSCFFTPRFAELLGTDDSFLGITASEVFTKLATKHKPVNNTSTTPEVQLVLETDINKIIKIEMTHTPDVDNSISSLIISAIDISHEYNLDKMKSYFMSAASHELRTPLSSLCGFSELLMECRDSYSTEEQALMIRSIHTQSQTLTNIVSQLLDVSLIEAGRNIDVETIEVDLSQLVPTIIEDFRSAENSHLIICNIDKDCIALAQIDYITRIVTNLLSNACKYSPEGTTVKVKLSHLNDGDSSYIQLDVIDQGIGMDKLELVNVFEKFYRSDRSGKIKGMGLGLHIVKELTESMNGDISIESQKGVGSTVRLKIPSI